MKRIARSAIVEHPPAAMYALVEHIEAYPEFLPWTAAARTMRRRIQNGCWPHARGALSRS